MLAWDDDFLDEEVKAYIEFDNLGWGMILARLGGEEIPRNIPLATSTLKQGASYILDPPWKTTAFPFPSTG